MDSVSEKRAIVILGPTASGKTRLAVRIAHQMSGEVINADSRQVYRGMDIGTGKDLEDYKLPNDQIKYHLIDIVNAGEKYNLSRYQRDFQQAYSSVKSRDKVPVIAGGTGLYIEAVLKNYSHSHIPVNHQLRDGLSEISKEELLKILTEKNHQNIDFDTSTDKRLVRAIEICEYLGNHEMSDDKSQSIPAMIFGIRIPRKELLFRIKKRLSDRLNEGLIEEVRLLMKSGLYPEQLIYYGLEYKFVTLHVQNQLTYGEMLEKLNVAIRQYAKRQMTYFRRMERNGFDIHWIDGMEPLDKQKEAVLSVMNGESY